MSWTRRIWTVALVCLCLAFFSGTHLAEWHLWIAVPSVVIVLGALFRLFRSQQETLRSRGAALTLVLVFVFSSLLGWSVFINTIAPLYHGIAMGLFSVGVLLVTYDLFWPEKK